jgi:hypothetical protein
MASEGLRFGAIALSIRVLWGGVAIAGYCGPLSSCTGQLFCPDFFVPLHPIDDMLFAAPVSAPRRCRHRPASSIMVARA